MRLQYQLTHGFLLLSIITLAADHCAASQSSAAVAPQVQQSSEKLPPIVVEVEGVGSTYNLAIDSALSEAVLSAVGGLIDDSVTIENDVLVATCTKRRSSGIIQKYEVLSTRALGAETTVRIRAIVTRDHVIELLGELKASSDKVSGKSLIAKRKSLKKAEGDLAGAIVPGIVDLLSAPFTASISEESMLNAIGTKLPEVEGSVVIPIFLELDLDLWNQRTQVITTRLDALRQPIHRERIAVTNWRLADPKSQADFIAFGKHIRALTEAETKARDSAGFPTMVQSAGRTALVERKDGLGVWFARVLNGTIGCMQCGRRERIDMTEAAKPGTLIAGGIAVLMKESTLGKASLSVSESQLPLEGSRIWRSERIAILSEFRGGSATLSIYELPLVAMAQITAAFPPTSNLEVTLVDANGGNIAVKSLPLHYSNSTLVQECNIPFSTTDQYAGTTLFICPGRFCNEEQGFGRIHRSACIETGWMGTIAAPFSEAALEQTESMTIRCTPGIKTP